MEKVITRRTATIAASLVAGSLLLGMSVYRPAQAENLADGVFSHDCCGTLALQSGRMVVNGRQAVTYTVGQDKYGAYIVPKTYVGTFEDEGFEIDGTRPATKLRLDRLPQPTSITLREGRNIFVLKRKNSRSDTRLASHM
jgi:hypothetical protein